MYTYICIHSVRGKNACAKLIDQIRSDPNHKYLPLLPEPCLPIYDLRKTCLVKRTKVRTDRFLRTFISFNSHNQTLSLLLPNVIYVRF